MARIIFLTGWKAFNIKYPKRKITFEAVERRTTINKNVKRYQK